MINAMTLRCGCLVEVLGKAAQGRQPSCGRVVQPCGDHKDGPKMRMLLGHVLKAAEKSPDDRHVNLGVELVKQIRKVLS